MISNHGLVCSQDDLYVVFEDAAFFSICCNNYWTGLANGHTVKLHHFAVPAYSSTRWINQTACSGLYVNGANWVSKKRLDGYGRWTRWKTIEVRVRIGCLNHSFDGCFTLCCTARGRSERPKPTKWQTERQKDRQRNILTNKVEAELRSRDTLSTQRGLCGMNIRFLNRSKSAKNCTQSYLLNESLRRRSDQNARS